MKEKENCYVITADLAHLSGLDRVKQNYPDRLINVGIAEQNMIGVAAGLAFEGNLVFATTYATFISMRSYEQIRHHLGYQKANVKIIGSASGLAMGMSGNTHYSYEDIAIMRAIPNMTVISPADASEAYQAVYAADEQEGPMYIRLSGNLNEKVLYQEPYDFQIGKAVTMKKGKDIVIIATGGSVSESIYAAEKLEEKGDKPMPRGKRKTCSEKLEEVSGMIEALETQLKELKAREKQLLKEKREEELKQIAELLDERDMTPEGLIEILDRLESEEE